MIMGFFSVKNSQNYIRENSSRINSSMVQQTKETIDTMITELNTITLNFSINTRSQFVLRRILQKENLEYEDVRELELIQNTLSIFHFSREYIQSIYVYFENDRGRFITSEIAHTSLATFPDVEWFNSYRKYNRQDKSWWEIRTIPGKERTDDITVLTFYKLIYNSFIGGYNGLVVFNVYADYLRETINSLETLNDQTIFVFNRSGILVSNNQEHNYLLSEILSMGPNETELIFNGKKYTVTVRNSEHDINLIYASAIPNRTLYRLPNYLLLQNIVYIILSLTVGIALSLYFAHISNKQIKTIIGIIDSAKEGKLKTPESLSKGTRNSYQYILYNVINTFMEKDFLNIQLSEKMYKSRVDELTALQSQINPHFLFNTLQTINMKAMALGERGESVTCMIDHLSSILRYAFSDPGIIVPLKDEISNAKSYLAIQSVRYREKISVEWEYSDSILMFGTIKLLLQPVIENSIYHGIKEDTKPGVISIVIVEEHENLKITVRDTGVGIPETRLAELSERLRYAGDRFEHIGLFNTNRRIKLTFGDRYGISISSRPGNGTSVEIRIPKIRSEENQESLLGYQRLLDSESRQ